MITSCCSKFPTKKFYFLLFVVVFHVYTVWVTIRNAKNGIFLWMICGKIYSFVFVHLVYSKYKQQIHDKLEPLTNGIKKVFETKFLGVKVSRILPTCLLVAFYAWILSFVVTDAIRRRSLLAMVVMIAIAWILSNSPLKVKLRPVLGAFTLQFLMAIIFLKWESGHKGLQWVVNKVVTFLDFTSVGSSFVYGMASAPPHICEFRASMLFSFLQALIFFAAFVELMYHWGIVQAVLKRVAFVMENTVGTTSVESLNAAACIFVGQTEAALLIGEALPTLTESQLHAIMTAGFSCIAGSLFSAFISFGACPIYLLTATVMSACGSLAYSKILCPETEENVEETFEFSESKDSNIIGCLVNGSAKSARLIFVIGANLLVFLSLLHTLNVSLEYLGMLVGLENISLNKLIGWLFYPLAYLMAVSDSPDPDTSTSETLLVAELMGIKTVVNEFLAYSRLSELIDTKQLVGARAQMMATFACCGFSNIGMIGNMLGVLTQLAPSKTHVFSKLIVKAMIGGCLTCFTTAVIAGIIINNPLACQPSTFSNCISLERLANHVSRNETLLIIG